MRKLAVISPCGKYRYQLFRQWDSTLPNVLFIMLNPSTADADLDDPTITKCIGFAKLWGYGGLFVANLWAYRATDPKELKHNPEIISEDCFKLRQVNNSFIALMSEQCKDVIFAWGTDKNALPFRTEQIIKKFPNGKAITISKHGKPCHPLYLKKTLTPIPFSK